MVLFMGCSYIPCFLSRQRQQNRTDESMYPSRELDRPILQPQLSLEADIERVREGLDDSIIGGLPMKRIEEAIPCFRN